MSLTHWLVVIVIALLLFGRGKISDMMGDLAKGIKSFKKGMAEEDETRPAEKRVEALDKPRAVVSDPEPVKEDRPL